MNEKLEWLPVKVKLKDLKDNPNNPRNISKKEMEKLVRSIEQDGYHGRILVDTDKNIIGGHQRKQAMKILNVSGDEEIEVLMPNRELTETEFDRISIRDNLSFGEWDMDILANKFDTESLIDWGFDEEVFFEDVDISGNEEKPKSDKKLTKCPECGHEF